MSTELLDQILSKLTELPPEVKAPLVEAVAERTSNWRWVPNPGPQTEAYFSPADELFYGGQAGGGKELDDNTPVPVPLSTDPSGFKRHGDLKAGDEVYSPSGKAIEVLWVKPVDHKPDAYAVEFDTGETIVADADHLWFTWTDQERDRLIRASDEWRATRRANRPSRAKAVSKKPWVSRSITSINRSREHEIAQASGNVRNTLEIRRTLKVKNGRVNHSVDVCLPIVGSARSLPIEPYLFGLWLGDGHSLQPVITMMQADWLEIASFVPEPRSVKIQQMRPTSKPLGMRRFGFMPQLRSLGVHGAKRIPPTYLRASVEQRIALLQGILDTDGTCDHRGQIEAGFSNEALASDLHELVSSLGIKSTLRRKETRCQAGAGNPHWRIKFVCPFPAFRLPRKLDRQKFSDFRPTTKRRYIVSVRKTAPVSMRCIHVAADGLYLVGRSFIPTHNTHLGLGLALTAHKRSVLLRRVNKDAKKLVPFLVEIVGGRDGYNGQDARWAGGAIGDRQIDIAGCEHEDDKQRFKGDPRDLYYFDEGTDFSYSQYKFITGWNRSPDPKQRCRVVVGSNPPTTAEGLWVIRYWAAWLDPMHPNPAKPGELRWYTTGEGGEDIEVDGPGPHLVCGEMVTARSRTYIPAKLSDNPDQRGPAYAAVLAGLPPELRAAYRDGDFGAGLQDHENQVIPTAWIEAAQRRWRNEVPKQAMTAIGVDVAEGGSARTDKTVLAARYGGWYAPLVRKPGNETQEGSDVAALVVRARRNNCPVVVDVGGGFGAAAVGALERNGIPTIAYKGLDPSAATSREGKLKFFNRRAEDWWRFREELDPDQEFGSAISLPPDASIKADLAAPRWELTPRGIKIELKSDIKKRLGHSPDDGDAIVMAMAPGARAAAKQIMLNRQGGRPTRANVGHERFKERFR